MQIVESIGVSMNANATVQIVRVGEKYYLVGVTKENVTMLTELDESQIAFPNPQALAIDMPFKKVFEKFTKQEPQHEANSEQPPKD
jgi:flagellar biogenesis protein FliO